MAYNKVVYDGQVLIDLTDLDVTAGDVLSGVTVILADGTKAVGTLSVLQNLVDGSAIGSVRGVGTTAEDSSYTMGNYAFAEGSQTTAVGLHSHAENNRAKAYGNSSHAQGYDTYAMGNFSTACGNTTRAYGRSTFVIGEYNSYPTPTPDADTRGDHAFIIGNGTSASPDSNALTVDWNGNVNIPSGAKYKINGSALTASDVGALPSSQMLTGTIAATSVSANSYTDVSVTFSSEMSGVPIVVCGVISTSTAGAIGSITAAVTSTSTTGFTCRIFNAGSATRTPAVNWIALNI